MTNVTPEIAQDPVLELDLADPVVAALAEHAGRIAALLDREDVVGNPERFAPLDDLVGAVYALMFAHHMGFEDRADKPIELAPVKTRAAQAQAGRLRLAGKWLAGFHFNNAAFRVAAVQHRMLQLIVRAKHRKSLPELYALADAEYRSWSGKDWDHSCLDSVRSQVNELKHDPPGVFAVRTVSYEAVLGSVSELLVLVEAWLRNQAAADGA